MVRVSIILLLITTGVSAIPGIFVQPGMNSVPYDVLISNRPLYSPTNLNEVHLGAGYYLLGMNNEYYDSEGEVLERFGGGGGFTSMWLPIFADIRFNDIGRFGIVADLRYWVSSFGDSSVNDFVLSDVCLFGEKTFMTRAGWYFGPRVAFIYGVDDFQSTGYNDVDISAIIGKGAETNNIVLDSTIGGRYSFEYSSGSSSYSYQPGSTVYVNIRPGYAFTSNFVFYGVFDYAVMFVSKRSDGSDMVDSDSYALYSGVASSFRLNKGNSISCILEFPISGRNTDKELLLGINYDAYIPF